MKFTDDEYIGMNLARVLQPLSAYTKKQKEVAAKLEREGFIEKGRFHPAGFESYRRTKKGEDKHDPEIDEKLWGESQPFSRPKRSPKRHNIPKSTRR